MNKLTLTLIDKLSHSSVNAMMRVKPVRLPVIAGDNPSRSYFLSQDLKFHYSLLVLMGCVEIRPVQMAVGHPGQSCEVILDPQLHPSSGELIFHVAQDAAESVDHMPAAIAPGPVRALQIPEVNQVKLLWGKLFKQYKREVPFVHTELRPNSACGNKVRQLLHSSNISSALRFAFNPVRPSIADIQSRTTEP
jgi:hypothetical protein